MSVGPLGNAGYVAGAPLAQAKSAEERTIQESAEQARAIQAEHSTENAAGIGETEEHGRAFERDADGRRLWELGPQEKQAEEPPPESPRQGRDPSGDRGTQLDVSG
jgi:hypothetical protein